MLMHVNEDRRNPYFPLTFCQSSQQRGPMRMSIRVIDFRSPTAPAEFAAGLKEIGFAVLSHHPVPQDLITTAYQQWNAFFCADEKTKSEFTFDVEAHDGYASTELSETAKGYDK